jgi:hypothetical protein
MHHPELAFANVPFLKNRSLNWASFSVLLFSWSLDIIESSVRGSPTVTQPSPQVQTIPLASGSLLSRQLRTAVIAGVGCGREWGVCFYLSHSLYCISGAQPRC